MCSILITGITGFLGTEIASEIMQTTDYTVYGLVRAGSYSEAAAALSGLWYERSELKNNIGSRIKPVLGDITAVNLGISKTDYDMLVHKTDCIIHAAALVGINHTREQYRDVNVKGTKNVLDFAEKINSNRPLKRLSYVSTAYTAGTRSGIITEDSLINAGFCSLYEQSKFEAEALVKQAGSRIPVSIFRPGQIVGNSKTGQVKSFNTLYYPLKLYLKKKLYIFPVKKSMRVNMVPVDYAAKVIVCLTCRDDTAGKTFHLTAPASMQPTVKELINFVREWAKTNLSLNLPKPLFFSPPFLKKIGVSHNMSEHKSNKKSILNNMLSLLPYFSENRIYDTTNTEAYVGTYNLDRHEYLPRLLSYAVSKNFLNHNSRTVYEQAEFCLKRRTPVTYYDVTAEGIKKSSASSVYERIEAALKSLQAMGVGPGCKVAVSGINSVSYFVLDIAIGLSGAASVPLYYTTPADELSELLKKSGAGWFFIGDTRILSYANRIKFNGKIISFTENRPVPENSVIMSREQFLSLGKGKKVLPVHASYDDIATIRCTSGTTGSCKTAAFTHYQLKWLAETMASLLSFKSRCKNVSYLSFLPLSHVVEGILGIYTPYYLGTPLSLYFLNDFGRLAETLPKVRPNIFFSVPRFYEKLWEQLAETKTGRLYISGKSSFLKKILRPVLKRALLKKSGLDKCDQLIVGSAPVSLKLLENFKSLGIEIHNAYGLTEAPLITLNRLGENDISTAGSPLPNTSVITAGDSEILVSGPQVALTEGSRNMPYLHTGDLGVITPAGHLQIIGRKKEILINSYGKNINLQKVETLLKDIPFISEAVLIEEKKPYCTALLWPENNTDLPDEETLASAVLAVNSQLSHPEQIKRYALISSPLKISSGELTPNLKLRRENIINHYQNTIDGLYCPEAVPTGNVFFIGAL